MSELVTVDWMARLLAVAAGIAALELLWVRRAWADDGVFAWPVLRRELSDAPRLVRGIADRVMGYRGMMVVVVAQLVAALALPWSACPVPAAVVVGAALVIAIRFRGSYNGGSDAMLIIVGGAVALARLAPGTGLARAALGYAAAQLVLSYFVSGIAKLRDPVWRAGRALPILVRLPQYRVPAAAIAVLSRPGIAWMAGWAMLGFECGFPLALVRQEICIGLLAVGVVFHVVNAFVFGLNRFLWTWLAAYPALVFWVDQLRA